MAMQSGPANCVFEPAIVSIGATFPDADAANSSISLLPLSATHILPAASRARHSGKFRPVLLPEIVTAGATLPLAPGAQIWMPTPALGTMMRPVLSITGLYGALSCVLMPVITPIGVALPFAFAAK